MKDSDRKAEELVNNKQVLKISETDNKVYFVVKGTKLMYQVIYDKNTGNWNCPCNNIRLTDCYHIKGCKKGGDF